MQRVNVSRRHVRGALGRRVAGAAVAVVALLGIAGSASAASTVATATTLPYDTPTSVTLIGNPVAPEYWTLNLGLGQRVRLDIDAKLSPTVTISVYRPGVTDATVATAKAAYTYTAAQTATPVQQAFYADAAGTWLIRATSTTAVPFSLSATQLQPPSQVGSTVFSTTIAKAPGLIALTTNSGTTYDPLVTSLVSPRFMRVTTKNGDRAKLQVTGTNLVPLKIDVFSPGTTDAIVATATPFASATTLADGAVTNFNFTTPAGGDYIVRISSIAPDAKTPAQPGTFTVRLADVAPPDMQTPCATDRTNIGRVTIEGCVEPAGAGFYKATGVISFSGINVEPINGAKLSINAKTLEITSKGKFNATVWTIPVAYMQSSVDLGGLKHEFNLLNATAPGTKTSTYTTADGSVDWTQVGKDAFSGTSNIAGPQVGGLPLTGKFTIQFMPDNGGQVDVEANVKIPGWSSTGTLAFATSLDKPIVRASVAFGVENTGGLTFNANLGYSEEVVNNLRQSVWKAGFKLDMGTSVPPAKIGGAEGALEIRDGQLVYVRGAVSTNIAIGSTGIFVTKLGASLRWKPYFQITGIAAVAVGPKVAGVSAAEIAGEGGFATGGRCPLSQVDANRWFFDGQATIASWFTVANFGVCAQLADSPFVTAYLRGGFSAIGLVEGNANLTGYIDGTRAWMVEGDANLKILGGLKVNGNLVLSDYGVAACGKARALTFTLQVGVERRWTDGTTSATWTCPDFQPYRTVAAPRSARVAGEFPISVPAETQQVNVEVVGANGQVPAVDIVDPSGKVLASSQSLTEITQTSAIFVPRPETGELWISAPTPSAGTYIIRAQAGSTIERIRTSLPEPKAVITAKATPQGRKVRVDYSIQNLDGRMVQFWELGDGLARRIGVTRKSSGSITFVHGVADNARHRITAVVYNHGQALPSETVATFRTPKPKTPGTPVGLRAVHRGGKVTVSWKPVKGALGYRVGMVDTDGHVIQKTITGTSFSYRPSAHGDGYVLVNALGYGTFKSRAARAVVTH